MAFNKSDKSEGLRSRRPGGGMRRRKSSALIAVKMIRLLIIRIRHILKSLYPREERYFLAVLPEVVRSIKESLLPQLREQDI